MIAVGVDTHKHRHVAVALNQLGQVLGEISVAASAAGYRELVSWLAGLGGEAMVGIEGAGSYGAGLCRHLQAAGISVVEVERPRRRDRRQGKSDRVDALLAAKRVLASDGISTPRADGNRAALSVLLVAYRSCVEERTRLLNRLQGLHVTAPTSLRERIGHGNGARLADRLVRMRDRPGASRQEQTTLTVLRDLAKRARQLEEQADRYRGETTRLVRELNPTLLDEPGVGPISAAKLFGLRPSALQERSRVCALQRHRAPARIVRPDDPPPPLPQRRPPGKQRDPHDRDVTVDQPRRVARLPGAQNPPRQDPQRSHALAQTPRLPPPLPTIDRHALDTIEASNLGTIRTCIFNLRSRPRAKRYGSM
jgi:transposase